MPENGAELRGKVEVAALMDLVGGLPCSQVSVFPSKL